MSESPRIEDLRKRYHENPRRFFAPLANEYRKAGHLDRALLLCEKHLKEQPDNMNGLVVYGQSLFESERLEDAKEPLTAALGVDPENLIALRLLGDISRLGDDIETAKMWYEKVLGVDRRNDEVLDLLQQMAGGDAGSADESAAQDSMGMIDLDPPAPVEAPKPKAAAGPGRTVVIDAKALAKAVAADAVPVPEPPPAPAPRPSRRASLLDVSFDFSEIAMEDAPTLAVPEAPVLGSEAAEYGFVDTNVAEPLDTQSSAAEPPAMADSLGTDSLMIEPTGDVAPMGGLEPTEFTPAAAEPAATLEGLQTAELEHPDVAPLPGLESAAEDVFAAAPAAEDEVVSAEPVAEEPVVEEPSAEEPSIDLPMLEPEPAARPRPRMTKASMSSLPLLADYGLEDDSPSAKTPVASAAPVPSPAAEEPRKSAKTPAFVTETMAALYIKQGYTDQAIEVYRQLVAQDPADAGLKERLAALERGDETGLDFEAPAADAPEPTPAPANAVLDDVSFAEVGLSTPAPAAAPMAMPAASGPSAREFFGAFARRAVGSSGGAVAADAASDADTAPIVESATVPAPAPAAPSGWPLDALFGAATDVADLHAAEVIASVGTFEGPNGGTGLDQLFVAASAPRATVNRASETLKFDQFFSPTGAAPAAGAAAPEAQAPAAPTGPETPSAAGDDDLDQFQGWLKGLKPE